MRDSFESWNIEAPEGPLVAPPPPVAERPPVGIRSAEKEPPDGKRRAKKETTPSGSPPRPL